jgi:hypothetical protein
MPVLPHDCHDKGVQCSLGQNLGLWETMLSAGGLQSLLFDLPYTFSAAFVFYDAEQQALTLLAVRHAVERAGLAYPVYRRLIGEPVSRVKDALL